MIGRPSIDVPPQNEGEALRKRIETEVQRSLKEGLDGASGVGRLAQLPPLPPGTPRAPQPIIDALMGQIAAEREQIQQLTQQLSPGLSEARTDAITDQLSSAQERLSSLQSQLDRALGVSRTVAIAGGDRDRNPFADSDIPQRVENMVYSTFLFVGTLALGIPLIRAFGRRVDRKTQVAIAAASSGNPNVEPRLERIEQAVEAIAIEIERVSEGQRYTNKLMSEMRALPAPNPLEQWPKVQEKEGVRRDK
jgi:hypothetical protein